MAKNGDYDWLEDPFDDEKSKKELEEAKKSKNKGMLVALLVLAVFLIVVFASCSASLAGMSA